MKNRLLFGIFLGISLTLTLWHRTDLFSPNVAHAALNKPAEAMPSLNGQPAIDYLKQHGLFERVQQTVDADRHEIKWQSQTGGARGAWKATNRGQNLEASFSRDGALIAPGPSCTGASWQMALKLRGVGYGDRLSDVVSGPIRAKGNRIEFQKLVSADDQQSPITEWYVNKPEGIEQGFTLADRPEPTLGIEPLRVVLSVTGDLHAKVEDAGQAITLSYRNGRQALRYDHLVTYDALGRTLPSRMEVSDEGISLLVDDASAVYPVTIDPVFTEVKKLTASDESASDQFGYSVSISGDTALVGARSDDSNKGAAYVFERNKAGADLWGEVKKLTASDGVASDQFGFSVALSGDTAIVGAYLDDSNKGAAYIFERNKTGADLWGEVKKLTASDGVASDQFGYSVAISGDTALVGARGDDGAKGAAYVFERNKTGADFWGEVKKLTASDGVAGDQFGFSVAISGDTAIVAGLADDIARGAAYIFERNKTGADLWGEVKKLTASDGVANDQFGFSVAISGDTALVGAFADDTSKGAAYVFERNKTGADLWGEVKKLTASDGAAVDRFGWSVAISGDTALVGAFSDDSNKGAAYVFERNKTGADLWGEVKRLTASDGVAGDAFGSSVAISGDTAIVGALSDDSGRGAAYIFASDCNWAEKRKPLASDGAGGDQFAFSVAISGDTAIVGAWGVNETTQVDQGAAYIFTRNQGGADNWGQLKKIFASDGGQNDKFGFSVAISGDTAIVGAIGEEFFDRGAAYVFARNQGGADNWGQVRKLLATDGVGGDTFGNAVGISGDTAIVGAYLNAGAIGAAYIYERNLGGLDQWGQVKKLIALDGAATDRFGYSVGISVDTAIVGAYQDDGNKGAAYIFGRNKLGADQWGEVKKLVASDGAATDEFGFSVAISVDTAIVGSRFDDGKGSAYIYERNKTGVDLWGEVKKLTASDGATNDRFGTSVSISVDTALVGANGDDANEGAAYVYGRNEGGVADNWGEVIKLTASDAAGVDLFGTSAAISGDNIIVGAYGDNTTTGSSYIYVCETIPPNTAPTITGATLSRTQGATGPVSTIATVGDGVGQDAPGSLTVTVLSAPSGITVTGITNTTGTITANVAAACNATPGDNIVQLQVQDSGLLTATADLIVNVVEITLPALPGGTAGTLYSQSAAASPAGVYAYSVSGGSLPPGLSLDPSTGLLSGTPTTAGTFNFNITAVGGGCTIARGYSVLIGCPAITLSALPGGLVNTAYSQTITGAPAGTTYTFALTSGTLPTGLTLSPTGTLSGSPLQSGTFNFRVTGTGFGTCTGFRDYTINIGCPVITINPATLPNGTIGAPYAGAVSASPAGAYSFSVTGGGLPDGLVLDAGTGAVTGTSTTTGTFEVTITATSGGCSNSKSYTILIGCPTITLSALPGGTLNTAYSQTITATPAGPTYSFAVTSGALPAGLTLSPTGALTGAPTLGGTFNFTVTATGPGPCTGFRGYQLIVSCPVITLNPASLPGGTLGTAYAQSVSASPAGVYTFSLISGGLPAGLSLNPTTGAITGTPLTAGSSTFTIRAAAGSCSGTRTYTIAVVCPALTITTISLPSGTAGTNYSQQVVVSPAGSYTYSLAQGTLPSGVTLNAATGLISGLPLVPGTYSFIVKTQTANGCIATQALSITIVCPTVTLSPVSLPGGQIGTAYSQSISVSPAGIYAFSFTGSLPPGLVLNPVTGLLSGTPTANGTFNFNVTATRAGGCSGSRSYSVLIAPGGCPTITLSALPNGKVGTLYSQYVTVSPAASYTYSLTGTLPPGLTFYSAIGLVMGYPTTAGGYSFSITATNLNSCTGTRAYAPTIAP